MLKLAALTIIGFVAVVTIAPSGQFSVGATETATTFQHDQTQQRSEGKLYAGKLLPAKKAVKLGTAATKGTSVQTPNDRKPELSPVNKEPQPIKSQSQRELEDRSWLRPNERPINVWDNSANGKGFSGFGNFHNVNR
jgi:hypothetical protein